MNKYERAVAGALADRNRVIGEVIFYSAFCAHRQTHLTVK